MTEEHFDGENKIFPPRRDANGLPSHEPDERPKQCQSDGWCEPHRCTCPNQKWFFFIMMDAMVRQLNRSCVIFE